MSKGAYTPEFTPVARPGHIVRLDDGSDYELYEVERYTALPHVPADSITVSSNSTQTDVNLSEIHIWDGWLAQYRLLDIANELPDQVKLELDMGGKQAPMWTTQSKRGRLDRESGVQTAYDSGGSTSVVDEQYSNLYELFVHEQTDLYATVTNDQGSQVTVDLTFSGFAFQLEPLEGRPSEQPIHVPVSNIKSR